MLYLSHQDILKLPVNWAELIESIATACHALAADDFCQPIKPYVTFENSPNRIIAMPAFIGGEVNSAGVKWIASFPNNIEYGIARAQSVTILNNAQTGVPETIINTSLVSALRTAAVTGLVIREYLEAKPVLSNLKLGVVGFGVIAQTHLEMLAALFSDSISEVRVFDPRGVDLSKVPEALQNKVSSVSSWQESFEDIDMFITATTSAKGYIDAKAKPGSLHLNVSLRDYVPAFCKQVDVMLVDNWEEICRHNTDIENMHLAGLLNKSATIDLPSLISKQLFNSLKSDDIVMFNPMGMAVFDLATGVYVKDLAEEKSIGTLLEQ